MTSFWIISGILIVVALLFVIPSLIRNKSAQEEFVERDAVNVTVYRDQLADLAKDLENDILTQEQYLQSKQELQQRMLQDIPEKEEKSIKKSSKLANLAMSLVIVMALPVAAVYIYLEVGDTRGLLPQTQLANVTQQGPQPQGPQPQGPQSSENAMPEGHDDFSSVLENLIARLNDNPEDIEGWIMLGRTYAIMRRYDEAASTYAKLTEMVPDSPEILSDYADVLAMANDGSLAGKPAELIQQALQSDPEYPKALALAGTVEFEQNDFDQAAMYWERLLAVIPPESELAQSVNESIAEAKSLAGKGSGVPQTATAETDAMSENNRQQKQQQSSSAASTQSDTLSISGTVTISDAIASSTNSNDTLFIYARAESGPKMPLAILRLKAGDLPTSFTLTDAMAMTPAMKLSSFPTVVIEARISKSGQAVPSSGDLQGLSEPVKVGTNNVSIEIDSRIP